MIIKSHGAIVNIPQLVAEVVLTGGHDDRSEIRPVWMAQMTATGMGRPAMKP